MRDLILKEAERLAKALGIDATKEEVINVLKISAFQKEIKDASLLALLLIASKYRLNPWTREIYAFETNGAVVPIVGVDGWVRIMNEHPQFDGLEFIETDDACTCIIYRKDRSHPIKVTEYLSECKPDKESITWKRWPRRMLRHKAMIQCARIAFGLSGIYDPDEAERIKEAVNEPPQQALQQEQERPQQPYPEEKFNSFLPKWQQLIDAGKSAEQIIQMVSTKYTLTEEQKQAIRMLEPKGMVIDAETGEIEG